MNYLLISDNLYNPILQRIQLFHRRACYANFAYTSANAHKKKLGLICHVIKRSIMSTWYHCFVFPAHQLKGRALLG